MCMYIFLYLQVHVSHKLGALRIVVDVLMTCIDIDIRASGGSSPLMLELLSNFCLARLASTNKESETRSRAQDGIVAQSSRHLRT